MKQLIIGNGDVAQIEHISQISQAAEGAMFVVPMDELTEGPDAFNRFAVGVGTKGMPFMISDIPYKNIRYKTRATGTAEEQYEGKVTIPTPIVGYTYTLVLAKKGVKFNERNKWSYSVYAKSTDAAVIASSIIKQVNASSETSGVTAEANGADITISGTDATDYKIMGADELMGVEVTETNAKKAILDVAYIQDLASQCAAGKGFNYTADEGKEYYPGYPEQIPTDVDAWVMYTIKFGVDRLAGKTTDEVVDQVLHLVMPEGSDADELAAQVLGVEINEEP